MYKYVTRCLTVHRNGHCKKLSLSVTALSTPTIHLPPSIMKFTSTLPVALCASLAFAAPAAELERRTSYNGGVTANDVKNGGM